mmetsp:Transcript_82549/g.188683  ORF Transcript_82549/g.188683 Transcript_82549/m.188683 type:complete len:204 (-) Transcript_82549:153-764(-)
METAGVASGPPTSSARRAEDWHAMVAVAGGETWPHDAGLSPANAAGWSALTGGTAPWWCRGPPTCAWTAPTPRTSPAVVAHGPVPSHGSARCGVLDLDGLGLAEKSPKRIGVLSLLPPPPPVAQVPPKVGVETRPDPKSPRSTEPGSVIPVRATPRTGSALSRSGADPQSTGRDDLLGRRFSCGARSWTSTTSPPQPACRRRL